jgi:murein DD-endopeptidase MepM/ murein hydrolase activator NlpD
MTVVKSIRRDFQDLLVFLLIYIRTKVVALAHQFEGFKNWSVDRLMLRRGVLQKSVWHGSMVGLSAFGIVTSGVFGGQTIVSATFPGVGGQDPRFAQEISPFSDDPVINSLMDTHTTISQKPRSEIIEYEIKSGDTVSTIAQKFGISSETILWANDMDRNDQIKPGQTLKILPVSGIAHTVKSGDSLESIAKKYDADSQSILDFPFNDVSDDLKLRAGQVMIVPDGIMPQSSVKPQTPKAQPQYLANGPASPTFNAPGGAGFVWPTSTSGISQYFAWYHPGLDLPNRAAPPVVSSDGGTVVVAGWPDNYGYGNRVVVDHGNGYKTLYAHLSNIYVSVGQHVSRGQTIGKMGSTGRSTGTHLHFEIHYKGIAVNPLSILK